jgi:hypothetical protein
MVARRRDEEMNHTMVSIGRVAIGSVGSMVVAQCTCRWTSTPAWSETHARERWRIHASQQAAADRGSVAVSLGASIVRRHSTTAELRAAVSRRRREVREAHIALLAAIRAADTWATGFRAPTWRMLDCARELAGASVPELWFDFISLGGNHDVATLEAMFRGSVPMSHGDESLITVALNERFRDQDMGSPVALRRDLASASGSFLTPTE